MIKTPMMFADAGARLLTSLDAEDAHAATIRLLKAGLGPREVREADPRLQTQVAGLSFPNPLGLAAGFDKNAEARRRAPCSLGSGLWRRAPSRPGLSRATPARAFFAFAPRRRSSTDMVSTMKG